MTGFWAWAWRMSRVHESQGKPGKGPPVREMAWGKAWPWRLAGTHHAVSVKGQVASVPGFGYVACCTPSSSLFSSFFSSTTFICLFIYLFLAVLGLHRRPGSSLVAASGATF